MEIKYYELSYEDIAQISRMDQEFFSSPWSEASIGHYADAGNTIFVVARSEEPYLEDSLYDCGKETGVAGETYNPEPGSAFRPAAACDEPAAPRRVVGYAAILCAADEGNLVSIGVQEDCREMGIATELLDICYEMAAERGVTSINLEVRESNTPAISLYEREGFECVGRRKNFYRSPAEDALLYIRKLPSSQQDRDFYA